MDISKYHEFDPAYVEARLNSSRRFVVRSLARQKPWTDLRFNLLQSEFEALAAWSTVSQGVTPEVWWALDGAAATARAQFVRASVPAGQQVQLTIADTSIVTESTGAGGNPYTTAPNWLRALWIGLVARDAELLTVLRDFPPESMAAAVDSGVSFDQYNDEWAIAWQLRLRNADGDAVARQVAETERLCDPAAATVAPREWTRRIAQPSIRLLESLASGNPSEFTADVRTALEESLAYFTRPVENRVRDELGFFPWQILGPVCAAVDSGFPVDLTSPYLPDALLYDRRAGS